ncbi:Riboflavin synthase eubacterial/eukaryotic [hydrothermal vent metagenome]|uniref:Riboflavin synthase eubacterial/eukaryotic n=1 Tax=hydrothermal vent metagenome TaxID=652676 RepID=A0A3B1D6K0_9ZZZZ
MFTGIIEETGIVKGVKQKKNLSVLTIQAKKVVRGAKVGDSIAVNGVCLTVTGTQKGVLSFDIMKESLACTTLGNLSKGSKVNLERALKVNGRIDGHFVSGHVDDVVKIKKIVELENYTEFQLSLKKSLNPFLVPKGSVCLDGISLTVGKVTKAYFSVYLIPLTKQVTTFGEKKKGDVINIETDILAKYLLQGNSALKLTIK